MSGNRIRATHPQHRGKADRDDNPTVGSAVCTRCQAIYHDKHWLLTGEKKRGILGASRALPARGALRSWPPFGWRSGRPRPRPRSGTDVASPAAA